MGSRSPEGHEEAENTTTTITGPSDRCSPPSPSPSATVAQAASSAILWANGSSMEPAPRSTEKCFGLNFSLVRDPPLPLAPIHFAAVIQISKQAAFHIIGGSPTQRNRFRLRPLLRHLLPILFHRPDVRRLGPHHPRPRRQSRLPIPRFLRNRPLRVDGHLPDCHLQVQARHGDRDVLVDDAGVLFSGSTHANGPD